MTTYLTIMVTVLAVCEAVRIVQNHINLRRQWIVFERECGHLSDFTDGDLKTQREAYRLIVENLTQRKVNNPIVPRSTKSGLKPCPFCGGDDVHVRIGKDGDGTEISSQIECYDCLSIYCQAEACCPEDQIAAWNRRDGNGSR